jgi:hypothetical protein
MMGAFEIGHGEANVAQIGAGAKEDSPLAESKEHLPGALRLFRRLNPRLGLCDSAVIFFPILPGAEGPTSGRQTLLLISVKQTDADC